MTKNETLRKLCREYLYKLRYYARKRGLGKWWSQAVKDTSNKECRPTEAEVTLLARAVDDDMLYRNDIPELLGKNYRKCFEQDVFDKIKKRKKSGIYSKVNAIIYTEEQKHKNC